MITRGLRAAALSGLVATCLATNAQAVALTPLPGPPNPGYDLDNVSNDFAVASNGVSPVVATPGLGGIDFVTPDGARSSVSAAAVGASPDRWCFPEDWSGDLLLFGCAGLASQVYDTANRRFPALPASSASPQIGGVFWRVGSRWLAAGDPFRRSIYVQWSTDGVRAYGGPQDIVGVTRYLGPAPTGSRDLNQDDLRALPGCGQLHANSCRQLGNVLLRTEKPGAYRVRVVAAGHRVGTLPSGTQLPRALAVGRAAVAAFQPAVGYEPRVPQSVGVMCLRTGVTSRIRLPLRRGLMVRSLAVAQDRVLIATAFVGGSAIYRTGHLCPV